MLILGIETSCDETSASIVEDGIKIISNVVASSQDMHAKTGGIIPEQAARQQIKSIISVIKEALQRDSIDALAVTIGPGLIGSLLVGVETAKTLSWVWDRPIIPVNHLIAHLYANFLSTDYSLQTTVQFPALGLVVSGGHTDLVLMKNHGDIEWIGGTRDDPAGEAFDKTARLLGLPYPGGPSISKAAEKYLDQSLNFFPRPLIGDKSFDFSFSGLKTAVLREVQNKNISDNERGRYAAEIQEAIVDVLIAKSAKAIEKFKPKSFLLAGGVAANKRLRQKFEEKMADYNVDLFIPEPKYCTDNAAIIACTAYFNYNPVSWKEINSVPELTIASTL